MRTMWVNQLFRLGHVQVRYVKLAEGTPMVQWLCSSFGQAHCAIRSLLELPRDRDGPQDRLNILLPAGLAVADILRRKGPREV